jgi:hypothetical protein
VAAEKALQNDREMGLLISRRSGDGAGAKAFEENEDPDLALNAIKLERRALAAIKLGLPELPEVEKPAI